MAAIQATVPSKPEARERVSSTRIPKLRPGGRLWSSKGNSGIVKPCRECPHQVSEQATSCPNCGAPFPEKEKWDGWDFEYKSEAMVLGLPLLRTSFTYRPNRVPVVARGVIAIGQFGIDVLSVC